MLADLNQIERQLLFILSNILICRPNRFQKTVRSSDNTILNPTLVQASRLWPLSLKCLPDIYPLESLVHTSDVLLSFQQRGKIKVIYLYQFFESVHVLDFC